MPTLYVLGGANGVGKTTWYQTAIENNEVDPAIPFINIDTIVLRELGGYTAENLAIGEQLARERMKTLIQDKRDFMIESNLSRSADYDWTALMRKHGYDTVLFFFGTKDVEINKVRVQARVREGGHDIAEPIIEHRYRMGISYLKSNVLHFSEATLIDVSTDQPREVAKLQNGQILYKEPNCPEWVQESLEIAEKLKQNLQFANKQSPKDELASGEPDSTQKEKNQRLQRRKGLGL
jgi:predicted ABC-type ATPase